MADQEHLDHLTDGDYWSIWRSKHPEIQPDFRGAHLRGASLDGADLRGADLSKAFLEEIHLDHALLNGAYLNNAHLDGAHFLGADLSEANFYKADLSNADLSHTKLIKANLRGADLSEAKLSYADLSYADLRGANLTGANLRRSTLISTNLSGCRIYGVSAWDVHLTKTTIQTDLIITSEWDTNITVDNLEVAQFIYLLLNNNKIRDVIDTITSKVVLILGRFTPKRRAVLDALRNELRKKNYLPVLFDFEKPANRDLTETVSTLAHLARFILVDLTDPSSAPHEVATIIPHTVVPVQPLLTLQSLIVEGKAVARSEYAMFEDLRRRYHWVLPTFRYQDTANLLASLQEHIIEPAEQKAKELAQQ